jgi:cytochrome P450
MSTSTAENFDVNLGHAGQLGNGILAELNKLRELDPVHWSESSGCWIVTRYDDISKALNDEYPLSYKRLEQSTFPHVSEADRLRLYPNMTRYLPSWIINVDPPIHTRLRKLLVAAFNKKVMDAVRPFVEQRVALLMDMLAKKNTVEFGEEIGRLLPGSVILKLLGIPQENLPRLRGWSVAFNSAIAVPGVSDEALQRCEAAFADMNTLFDEVIELRHKQPDEYLISAMIAANEAGDKLSREEMIGACQLIIVAGHDTTHSSLSLGMVALAQHPDYWDYMYRHPEETFNCTLELVRYMAMSTSQPRFVAEDFEWHGKQIKKGQVVFLMHAAGNRDPRVFSNPEKLDHTRANLDQSLSFSPGVHHCVGHLLAKLQLSTFFGELVKHFEGAELLDDKLHWMPQIAFRGIHDLNIRVKPRIK